MHLSLYTKNSRWFFFLSVNSSTFFYFSYCLSFFSFFTGFLVLLFLEILFLFYFSSFNFFVWWTIYLFFAFLLTFFNFDTEFDVVKVLLEATVDRRLLLVNLLLLDLLKGYSDWTLRWPKELAYFFLLRMLLDCIFDYYRFIPLKISASNYFCP